MAKFGLPIYPIYDEMPIIPSHTHEELDWMVEHGTVGRTWKYWQADHLLKKSKYGLPLYHQEVCKYAGKYVFFSYDDQFLVNDPLANNFELRSYTTLAELCTAEKFALTDRGPVPSWSWSEGKPDIFFYLDEALNLR